MLTCPQCGCRFGLTFARYFKAGPGNYTCPQCQAPGILVLPTWLKVVERSILIPGAVVGGVVIIFHPITGIEIMAGWLLLNIPLNMLLDGNYGVLHSNAVPPKLNTPPPVQR